jgi:L-iduronidase
MRIDVNCSGDGGPLDHFWRSIGLSPAELLLTPDMRQQIAYAGSIPHGEITYVRIHYLLELLRVSGTAGNRPQFDWSRLDDALDVVLKNGCVPFFELMGNPGEMFNDFNDDQQLHRWRDLVSELAWHATRRYGAVDVEKWYFESWNEPDAGWWRQWPADEQSFCNYYDACSEGLRLVNPKIRFGGPGTCRTLSSLFKAFLAHCDNGRNYFTGEKGSRLDFISIHEKGVRANKEDLNPHTEALWRREADSIGYIRSHHPRFAQTPFMNNECDPQVGWGDFHSWHGRPFYAAIACKIINQHLIGLVDGLKAPYAVLSNDNGFLGRWGNRTLLARFGAPAAVDDGQSHHQAHLVSNAGVSSFPPFELIKKPILNVMAMLSLLGNVRCTARGVGDTAADVGVIASRRGDEQVAILLYNSRDQIMSCGEEHVSLHLEHLPFKEAFLVHYRIDENHGDPYTLWEANNAPETPSAEVFALMRRNQELGTLEAPRKVAIHDGRLNLEFTLPLPSVSLIFLDGQSPHGPARIERVWCKTYEGLTGKKEVLVRWAGLESRGIRTYEVLAAASAQGPFQRVNDADLICTAYMDVHDAEGPRYYAVRAVGYWGRTGPQSDPVASQ